MNFGKVVLEVKNENGCVLIYRPLPDVVVTVSEGFITHDLWAPQVPFYDALHQQVPKLHVFPRRVERALRRARLCERLAGLREGEQGEVRRDSVPAALGRHRARHQHRVARLARAHLGVWERGLGEAARGSASSPSGGLKNRSHDASTPGGRAPIKERKRAREVDASWVTLAARLPVTTTPHRERVRQHHRRLAGHGTRCGGGCGGAQAAVVPCTSFFALTGLIRFMRTGPFARHMPNSNL